MSIVGARLDYRLLHGIVATQWTPTYNPQRIMIVDDKTANDPLLKEGMRMGKPAGVACSIISEETALTNFKAHKYDGQRIFLVTGNPKFIENLLSIGETIDELILGLSRHVDIGRKVGQRYAVEEDEEDVLARIYDKGVPIYVQYIPRDKKVEFIKK